MWSGAGPVLSPKVAVHHDVEPVDKGEYFVRYGGVPGAGVHARRYGHCEVILFLPPRHSSAQVFHELKVGFHCAVRRPWEFPVVVHAGQTVFFLTMRHISSVKRFLRTGSGCHFGGNTACLPLKLIITSTPSLRARLTNFFHLFFVPHYGEAGRVYSGESVACDVHPRERFIRDLGYVPVTGYISDNSETCIFPAPGILIRCPELVLLCRKRGKEVEKVIYPYRFEGGFTVFLSLGKRQLSNIRTLYK